MIDQVITMFAMFFIGFVFGFCIRIDDEYYDMTDEEIDEEIQWLREIKRRNHYFKGGGKK